MSNQLYGESQTMVKNIVFTVAKQQLLDPNGKVNAYNDGTDPVEEHFGYTRELGGHNSAMNFKQAVERTGWACDIRAVHKRNPGLHAGHRWRNITRPEIKDHLNEHNFTGDLVFSHCALPSSLWDGRVETMRIFKSYSRLAPEQYNIPTILRSKPGLDLLRPFDGITYPGISDDVDRSLPLDTASSTAINLEASVPVTSITPTVAPSPTHLAPTGPALELQATTESDNDLIDEMLPDPNIPAISFEELEPRPGVRPDDYLRDESGKFVHKASICRLVLDKEFVAKSKNRGQRAMALNCSISGPTFINGDLFITLVRTETHVSLAVIHSTEISVDGRRMPDVRIGSIKNVKANIKLTGQILKLKAVKSRPEDLSAESAQGFDESGWTWVWSGTYLMGKSMMKGTKIATDPPHILSVSGHLVEPINPMAANVHNRLSVDEVQ
ncbi:hypothetical protein B0H13DRAFT_2512065 [Mycena leptocephala]|nr:hypothetical protein B0H13DRAFT_2512065 [Mycena leptocephala]